MPKKKNPETQEQQSERFLRDVERLTRDGELSPTEAEAALNKLLGGMKVEKKPVPFVGDNMAKGCKGG